MSFDMFIMFFRDREPGKVSREEIVRSFGALADTAGGSWHIRDSPAYMDFGEDEEIEFISVNRPPHVEHPFWPALVRFLDETGGVLFWAGGRLVVTDEAAVPHLGPQMVEGFGPRVVAKSVEEILRAIEES